MPPPPRDSPQGRCPSKQTEKRVGRQTSNLVSRQADRQQAGLKLKGRKTVKYIHADKRHASCQVYTLGNLEVRPVGTRKDGPQDRKTSRQVVKRKGRYLNKLERTLRLQEGRRIPGQVLPSSSSLQESLASWDERNSRSSVIS